MNTTQTLRDLKRKYKIADRACERDLTAAENASLKHDKVVAGYVPARKRALKSGDARELKRVYRQHVKAFARALVLDRISDRTFIAQWETGHAYDLAFIESKHAKG